ncbi:MAG TPA: hypothetical protein VGH20_20915 [Myxococcales bacterium]|jgi:hypothetical protein
MDLAAQALPDFAYRFADYAGENEWRAYVVVSPHEASQQLLSYVREIGEACVAFEVPSAASLVTCVTTDELLIMWGFESWSNEDFLQWDLDRSVFSRRRATALVLTLQSWERLFALSPNIASWIGASVWRKKPDSMRLAIAEREQRLEALRRFHNLTDEAVVTQARTGQLPRDPDFAEWLILLSRSDLIG